MYIKSFFIALISTLNAFAITFTHIWDPYATHQPVLYEMALRTTGPIIEFGCGNGSTDLLHELCKKDGRLLISIDDDAEWLNQFSQKYADDTWHKFFFVPGKTKENNDDPTRWINFLETHHHITTMNFDLCFIDQNPWLARVETIKKMIQVSKYIILHDFNYYPMHNVFGKMIRIALNGDQGEFDFSDMFKYFKCYFPNTPWPSPYGPGTLLLSNYEKDFPDIDFRKY